MKRIELKDLQALSNFAAEFVKNHPQGAVVALNGELGAGKTAFVQSVAKHLCAIQGKNALRITSPTYVLHQSYADPSIEHFDWYRMETVKVQDLVEMGFWDAAERAQHAGGFVFVEWAERLPKDEVRFHTRLLFEVDDEGRHFVSQDPWNEKDASY